jgi:hypothetical protein
VEKLGGIVCACAQQADGVINNHTLEVHMVLLIWALIHKQLITTCSCLSSFKVIRNALVVEHLCDVRLA